MAVDLFHAVPKHFQKADLTAPPLAIVETRAPPRSFAARPEFPSKKAIMPNSPEALVAKRSSARLFAICWASNQSCFSDR